MKKYTSFKVLQLAILAILTILSLFLLLKPEVKQLRIFTRPATVFVFCRMGTVIGQLYFPADRF